MADNKKNQNTESKAFAIAKKAAEEYAEIFTLWDVIFEKTGALWYLRVLFIPADGAVIESDSYDEITAKLNELFDRESFAQNIDILEIGSAGSDALLRKPEHFAVSSGKRLLTKYRDQGKSVSFRGILEDCSSTEITVSGKKIPLGDCIKIALDSAETPD